MENHGAENHIDQNGWDENKDDHNDWEEDNQEENGGENFQDGDGQNSWSSEPGKA